MASLIWVLFMLLLPLISAEGSFIAPARYNHDFVPNAKTVWARAIRRWGTQPRGPTKIAVQKGQVGNTTAKTVRQDLEYLSLVGFGTPPQYLPMDLDTGSIDVWVCSTNMSAKATANRTVYDPAKSTTAVLLPNTTWEIEYGDESSAQGVVYSDTINIAGIELEQAIVESATQVSDEVIQDISMSGVFGLAYNLLTVTTPQQKSVFSALEPHLNSSLFTVDLKFHDDGEYEFGYIDSSKYHDEIYYVPLIDGAMYWSLNFTMYTFSGAHLWYAQDHLAIVDTGTSLMLLPNRIVDAYYAAVKGAAFGVEGWAFPCETKLPHFQLAFGHTDDSKFTIPGEYINYALLPAEESGDNNTCLGGIQYQDDIPFSILGDIFLKAVFAVFDYGNARVGFAAKAV